MTDTNGFQFSQPGSFADPLTEVFRKGARALLWRPWRPKWRLCSAGTPQVTDDGRQRLVRHGHLPEREIITGIGSVAVRCSRISVVLTVTQESDRRRVVDEGSARPAQIVFRSFTPWLTLALQERFDAPHAAAPAEIKSKCPANLQLNRVRVQDGDASGQLLSTNSKMSRQVGAHHAKLPGISYRCPRLERAAQRLRA